jgi:hypothetical protein
MLGNYHADPRYRLEVGRIVPIGEGISENSTCDHLLISLPYTFGPPLEWLRLEVVCVRFLWALPVTAREAAFAELHGYSVLEERFEKGNLNYLNFARASTI